MGPCRDCPRKLTLPLSGLEGAAETGSPFARLCGNFSNNVITNKFQIVLSRLIRWFGMDKNP